MFNMIKSDLYRIFKGKAIYISLIVIIILTVVSIVSMQPGYFGISIGNSETVDYTTNEELNNASSISEFRNIMKKDGAYLLDKDILGTNINLYYIFIVIIVIVITTDFSNKTIKNSLSSSISRKKYYFSKLIITFILCTIIILFNNFLAYILNYFVNGIGFYSSFNEIVKATLAQLPLLYGIISFLICIGFAVRKTSTFNTISIPFVMLFQTIVGNILNILKNEKAISIFENYEIQNALYKLVLSPSTSYVVNCIILGIIYIIVFNVIGYFSFKKAEIK